MSRQIIPVEPFDYVIFGGTGDLAQRKLLPALYHRDNDGQLPDGARLIAAWRSDLSVEEYQQFARQAIAKHVPKDQHNAQCLERFIRRLDYVHIDATSDQGWDELKSTLDMQKERRIRAFYLAVGPGLFGPISAQMDKFELIDDRTRLVIEKPLGRDLTSARELNAAVGAHFREDQVFRIDHYLGKETVQNLLALRFANALFEPLWNASHIDHVKISVESK